MLLGVIPMICFGILKIFGEKSQKRKTIGKSGHIRLIHHSVGNPRRSINLHQDVGYLAATRPRCQNGTPRVHRGVVVLCRGVAPIHSNKFFDFVYEHLVFVYR